MFCEFQNWKIDNVKPFLSLKHYGKYYIHSFKEQQKFVQFLTNGLLWRTLYNLEKVDKIITYIEKEKRII
ncbi:transcription termination factor 1-like isoform X1 [Vespula squamosa]|uniref:Transcription termination factor 1-like isoform X1 n=1 Tax=Vespula squamosa TaxID=30214 RepID=A0ABD1ZWQ8_VESSQ